MTDTPTLLRISVYFPNQTASFDRDEHIPFPLDDDEVRRMAEGIKAKNPTCSRILITEIDTLRRPTKVRFDTEDVL